MSPAHTMQQTIEKNNAPWLSVLIPVFNVQAYLEECVDSVMSQADRGVEVILLDDRSTDNSFAVMEMLAKRWPGQLTLMQHIVNSGPGAARNTMIDVAHGEYIWFLDSDDKLMPDCISELRSTIEMHAPDVVLCDFGVYRDQQTLKHKLRREHHKHTFCGRRRQLMHDRAYVLTGLLHTGQLHPWSKISRRALWNSPIRFPEGVYFEDMLPTLLMISRAQSFFYQPRPWVAYRQWNNSILASMTLKKACDQSMALLPLRNALKNESWADNPKLHFAWAHQC
ncbi:MAG: glycosyltransferase family 2 protein, partial [Oxalicibacterium faecigallinarum]|uniref:glycosyltransferase family 2 protein n=1 Tax=Oxalicibacterium faecigallinarum TaxID=573741 RepID=UPI002808F830